ncbi:hypothetical protein H2200_000693 [Cladophialophora chaetospira]|uniref:Carrier domain-containing protein n=1 Tax=Cladophialophora chaetospira TaxID=386627 RepID=A0AA38XP11_9EURO|nr:hypothetical protein H2200_000693 [Cladophialophora chaetospira]
MDTTYFTCTLGQAVNHQAGKRYGTINDFIAHKASSCPDTPVVGFYHVGSESSPQWNPNVLTFKDISRGTARISNALLKHIVSEHGQTVALLCPSSADFLFTWLALIRLGYPALLVAPQCSPSAIAQLCKTCSVRYLLYDEAYGDLAGKASREAEKLDDAGLSTVLLPSTGENIFDIIRTSTESSATSPAIMEDEHVAYLHHTSGTSSGTPKPIPQTHHGALGVLPTLDGRMSSSFTTTPLYHGGVADLFRAWTSNALIWLFPGKELPITALNVRKCLDVAATWAKDASGPEVKYFSSVPYVLQMMAEDAEGLKQLQRMDIVGVGGAALPTEVGDNLVRDGVNLISRFGSAECGFLMSSHRDYANDSEWQFLRSGPGKDYLRFEPREDGLSELVIQHGWPHMAKRNRKNGSYATADLFAPHSTIPDAWRYHSRSDSQLTLITGKKFDPAPLEDAIQASASTLLDDVLIFGNGQSYPGALLFRSADASSIGDAELVGKIVPIVEKLNRESQGHARISRNMLIAMAHLDKKLEKSSKGTILRTKAEERFAEAIDAAYEVSLPNGKDATEIPDSEVQAAIHEIVLRVAGQSSGQEVGNEDLTDETDLFNYGIDSVASMRIRQALSELTPRSAALPLSVVQDTGTISRLSELVLRLRAGQGAKPGSREEEEQEQHQVMLDLAKEYSTFGTSESSCPPDSSSSSATTRRGNVGKTVLLTGPTGSSGAHLLSQLLSNSSILKIHLLVRGATSTACRERIHKALSSRRLPVPADFDARVQIHSCKLSDPNLGLSSKVYEQLAGTVDVIVHLAWSVNFLLPLRSFKSTHLAGIKNLIDFALSSPKSLPPPRMIFCSSIAAVSNHTGPHIPEAILSDPSTSGPTGYARSKWVAEQICTSAHETTRLKNRISVARVGQLSGASDSGVWNASEAYPLMLSSMKVTRCLPDLDGARRKQEVEEGEVLGWLPVDVAARAFVEDILGDEHEKSDPDETTKSVDGRIPVTHFLNPSANVTWSDLLSWLAKNEEFETVNVQEWFSRLEALQESHEESKKNHPALKLLGFWKKSYSFAAVPDEPIAEGETAGRDANTGRGDEGVPSSAEAGTKYEMAKTYERMPSLRSSEGLVNEAYILKLWAWIKENV